MATPSAIDVGGAFSPCRPCGLPEWLPGTALAALGCSPPPLARPAPSGSPLLQNAGVGASVDLA